MEITLVNPKSSESEDVELHMSLLYLGTALDKNGHKVNMVDAQIEEPEKKLKSLINSSEYVGFSVMTPQVKHAVELSDAVKNIDKDVPVVWGGIHPTLYPKQTIEDNSVDYVVRGEGEATLLELAEHFEGRKKLDEIAGLVYRDREEIRITPERPYIDLNDLSPPNWNLMEMKKYIHDFWVGEINYGKSLPVHSGRGCVYRCTFCINTVLSRKKWRQLTAENIVNEIKILNEKYALDYIKFVDENFFINKKRVEEFCNTLIKEKIDIKWHATCRADYFNPNHLNEDSLKLVKESGCAVISMGVESGSVKVLNMLKKDITPAQVISAVESCKKFEIQPICSFMIGLPGETKEDIIGTLSLIKKIKNIYPPAAIIGPQLYRPYPGAELYDYVKTMFNEPNTLREWTTTKMFGGGPTSEHLPWIADREYVDAIWFYLSRAQASPRSIEKHLASLVFKHLARYRLEHMFFDFQIDKKIFEKLQHIYYKIKKSDFS